MAEPSGNLTQQREGGVFPGPGGAVAAVNQTDRANFLISMRRSPEWAPLIEKFPSFAVSLADHFVATAGNVQPFVVATLMGRYGVPRTAVPYLFSSAGGGRSQQDRENTIRTFQTSILFRAKQLGLKLKPEEVDYIARVAETQNYSAEQVDQALVGLIQWDTVGQGSLTGYRDEIRAMAKQYLVELPEQQLLDWATNLATGQATSDGYKSLIRTQAKLANPFLAKMIDEGLAPEEILAASKRTIATSLGLNEASISFNDPSFMKLVTVGEGDKQRLATNAELRQNIRQDSRWEQSDEARQLSSSLARTIAQIFGRSVY